MNIRRYIILLLLTAAAVSLTNAQSQKSGSRSRTAQTAATQKETAKSSSKQKTSKPAAAATGKSNVQGSKKKKAGTQKKAAAAKSATTMTAQQAKKEQENIQKEVADTRRAIRENDANIKKGLSDLQTLQGNINGAEERVKTLGGELNVINKNISTLQSRIDKENEQLEQLREEYRKAVKKMRIARKENSQLAYIFSSKNFNQALRRFRYLREFSAWRDKQTKEINKKVDALQQDVNLLAKNEQAKKSTMRREQQVRAQLQQDYSKKDAIVADLRRNGQALQTHLEQKQAEARALSNQISSLIAQEEAARRAAADKERKEQQQRKAAAEKAEAQRLEQERQREEAQKQLAEAKKTQTVKPADDQKNKKQSKAERKSTTTAKNKNEKVTASTTPAKTAEKPPVKTEQKPKADKPEKNAKEDKGKTSTRDYAAARRRNPRGDNQKDAAKTATASPSKTVPLAKPQQLEASASAPKPKAGGSNFENLKGQLPRPVGGHFRVKSPFGRHAMPGLPDVTYDNPGIDIETQAGAAARAVCDGKVSGIYKVPGFGSVIILSHGNYYTVYGNLASVSVGKGDSVKQGQSLGGIASDSDNKSHGELHFEVWRNRDKLNPSDWIK